MSFTALLLLLKTACFRQSVFFLISLIIPCKLLIIFILYPVKIFMCIEFQLVALNNIHRNIRTMVCYLSRLLRISECAKPSSIVHLPSRSLLICLAFSSTERVSISSSKGSTLSASFLLLLLKASKDIFYRFSYR